MSDIAVQLTVETPISAQVFIDDTPIVVQVPLDQGLQVLVQQGVTGPGLPAGGTTGQIPQKHSNADYDIVWVTGGGGGTSGQAQYSIDGSTSWHGTYASGTDLFIRISFDGAVTWTPAVPLTSGSGGVASVNTRTGAVVLTASDVGLGNANNTSDVNKPVSTAQATAIAAEATRATNAEALLAPKASPAFTGAISLGSLDFTDTNILESLAAAVNSYVQFIVQNTSNGGTASADVIVANDQATASTKYGDFGINSSGFTGSGPLNTPNFVYLTSAGVDLVIATLGLNAIHFLTNSATTDALTIDASNVARVPTRTALDASTAVASTAYADTAVAVEKARAQAAETTLTGTTTIIQYSVDGSTSWHTTYAAGADLFFRISTNNGTTWSPVTDLFTQSHTGTATLNFGTGQNYTTVAVTGQAQITVQDQPIVWIAPVAQGSFTAEEAAFLSTLISVGWSAIVAGTGFTISGYSQESLNFSVVVNWRW